MCTPRWPDWSPGLWPARSQEVRLRQRMKQRQRAHCLGLLQPPPPTPPPPPLRGIKALGLPNCVRYYSGHMLSLGQGLRRSLLYLRPPAQALSGCPLRCELTPASERRKHTEMFRERISCTFFKRSLKTPLKPQLHRAIARSQGSLTSSAKNSNWALFMRNKCFVPCPLEKL